MGRLGAGVVNAFVSFLSDTMGRSEGSGREARGFGGKRIYMISFVPKGGRAVESRYHLKVPVSKEYKSKFIAFQEGCFSREEIRYMNRLYTIPAKESPQVNLIPERLGHIPSRSPSLGPEGVRFGSSRFLATG